MWAWPAQGKPKTQIHHTMSCAKRPRLAKDTAESIAIEIDDIDATQRVLSDRRSALRNKLTRLHRTEMRLVAAARGAHAALRATGQTASRLDAIQSAPALLACNFLRDLCQIIAEFAEPACASALPRDGKAHVMDHGAAQCAACENPICSAACTAPRTRMYELNGCPHVICQRCRARADPTTFSVCYASPSRTCACCTGDSRACARCRDNAWVCGSCGVLHGGPRCAVCRITRGQ